MMRGGSRRKKRERGNTSVQALEEKNTPRAQSSRLPSPRIQKIVKSNLRRGRRDGHLEIPVIIKKMDFHLVLRGKP